MTNPVHVLGHAPGIGTGPIRVLVVVEAVGLGLDRVLVGADPVRRSVPAASMGNAKDMVKVVTRRLPLFEIPGIGPEMPLITTVLPLSIIQ